MRALSAEERALWKRVTQEVRALRAVPVEVAPAEALPAKALPVAAPQPKPVAPAAAKRPGTTLDGTWDRRLERGAVVPDATIDLHGHSLDAAYGAIDRALERAIDSGARTLLLITGRTRAGAGAAGGRGAIRAAVDDWLHASRHAGSIAAVRGASPRHGGQGALYIILRKSR